MKENDYILGDSRGTNKMDMSKFQESMYSLIVETSTNLPKDVRRAIKDSKAAKILAHVLL